MQAVGKAQEIRIRDSMAQASAPAFTAGAGLAAFTSLHRRSVAQTEHCSQLMATTGTEASGEDPAVSYKVGGRHFHAPDLRVSSLEAMAADRKRNWLGTEDMGKFRESWSSIWKPLALPKKFGAMRHQMGAADAVGGGRKEGAS